ncbi:Carbohydrate-Binding Module Family 50 protein [Trametes cinnabarina]|uniref:Carbohydrate-Binding Module Family 50 protein n=1 Tax=Pycnoporus cinnabarinus TaxID=5643 RepID=A0A060SSZ8_PYCCI|nr:Carbohydrate-Binding Module Family 50 protein [Trametes cinnabarina]
MGRWTQYDEDSTRLPEGMTRVGYDSDTGRYYFRDRDGSLWEGPQGAQYGEMKRVQGAPVLTDDHAHDEDEEAEIGVPSSRVDGYTPLAVDADGRTVPHARHTSRTDSAYRIMLPFFLIIVVVLLLVFRLVHSSPLADPSEPPLRCPGASEAYTVVRGDTCWELSQARGCSVQDILSVNQGLSCEAIRPGQAICLPPPRVA